MTLWEIHYWEYDERGKVVGEGYYYKKYKRKGNAIRVAKQRYGNSKRFRWHLIGRREVKPAQPLYDDIDQRFHYFL